SPCTAQDVISYPITGLDQGTPYMLQIRAAAADGTQSRILTSTFTTTTTPPVVPEATVALIASESSRCAARGGSFYTSPGRRGHGGSGGGRGGSLVPHRRGRRHRPGTRAGRSPRDPLPHRAHHRQHVRVPHQLQHRLRHLWQLGRRPRRVVQQPEDVRRSD